MGERFHISEQHAELPPRGSPRPHAASIAPRSPAAGPGGAAASPRAHGSNHGAFNERSLVLGGSWARLKLYF